MIQAADIARLRLVSQQLTGSQTLTTPAQLAGWMGAMQAQDYPMLKWAVGVRLPGHTDAAVEAAVARAEVIRTHAMRPTWHLIAATDVWWMLELTAPQIKAASRARHKELDITPELIAFSYDTFIRALEGGRSLSREVLKPLFVKAKVPLDDNRFAHLLMLAELDGILGSGVPERGKHTYALLSERVPHKALLSREESLARLALTYFRSHGPAALPDFIWWSGLPVGDARKALQMVQSQLASAVVDGETYWMSAALPDLAPAISPVYLLPAYDEYIISYKNRSASITAAHHAQAVSSNGIFRPMLVVDGVVQGIWSRAVSGKKVKVEVKPFDNHSPEIPPLIDAEIQRFTGFLLGG